MVETEAETAITVRHDGGECTYVLGLPRIDSKTIGRLQEGLQAYYCYYYCYYY